MPLHGVSQLAPPAMDRGRSGGNGHLLAARPEHRGDPQPRLRPEHPADELGDERADRDLGSHRAAHRDIRRRNSSVRAQSKGTAGALLAYLAIGCPVCNKLALIVLGASGAVQFFAPMQPYLAAAGIIALLWALSVWLRGEMTCGWSPPVDQPTQTERLGS